MRARLLVTLFLASCTRTETVTRTVNQHVTGACPLPAGLVVGKYLATGDFEPLAANLIQQPLDVNTPQILDGVPGNVQSISLLATPFLGATLVPPAGDVDMLLLPASMSCQLNGTGVGFADAMVFAAVSSKTIIALGATNVDSLQPSFRIDLGTGRVSQMTVGIGKPRTHAAVAALGDGRALVIGGIVSSIPEPSVFIFEESTGDFDPTKFNLQVARSDLGAVALVDGDVLVAGGLSNNAPVASTERLHFDGNLWLSTIGSTPPLQNARTSPTVIRLADGTILVGGGFDTNGPVSTIEFFTPDASAQLDPTTVLSPNGKNAFVALDGGGALYVDADAAQHAWFVAPKQVAIPITPDIGVPLTDVKLFPHDKGGALIWTGGAWWTFDPWSGCAPLDDAPTTGPAVNSPIASGEPGMRAWVAPDMNGNVVVWRDSIRNAFSTEGPYLVSDTSFMTPDALPAPVSFGSGGLLLSSTQSAFVADARFMDVAVAVDPGAHIVIRAPSGEVEVGGSGCQIDSTLPLYVERHGATVSFAQNGPLVPCLSGAAMDPRARVAVGVRGNGAAHNLLVTRLGAALP